MELLVITIFVIMIFVAFFLGFEFGKFKGAKDGIDYCFEQRKKEIIDNLNKP